MPWSPSADANLDCLKWLLVSRVMANIWWNLAIAPAFAWMGAFAEAVGGLLLFGFKPECFFWLFAPCWCYLYATNTKRIMELSLLPWDFLGCDVLSHHHRFRTFWKIIYSLEKN
jgi:hypothetical protein